MHGLNFKWPPYTHYIRKALTFEPYHANFSLDFMVAMGELMVK